MSDLRRPRTFALVRDEDPTERVVPPDLTAVRHILSNAQQGEIEGWDAHVMIDILWGLARHVDLLLAEVARLRGQLEPPPAAALLAQDQPLSEVDTLRAAAEWFARSAAAWREAGDSVWEEKHQYVARVLTAWAAKGGVARYGPETRAALAEPQAGSDG